MKPSLTKFNPLYSIIFVTAGYAVRHHYRSITIRGRENLPEGEAYILAPNHQNALMDPLVILRLTRKPVVFLARADIFRKPLLRKVLTMFRMMPVYRIRDGRDNLSRNDEIFSRSREVLEAGVPLCLMAEGTHNDKHQLLPLVKGMFRIAGGTQKELGNRPLYIVPVGLDYDDYQRPYSSVCVDVGKPIDVRQFMAEYETDEPLALNHMRKALDAALKAQMHQIDSKEHYDEEYAYAHLKTQEYLEDHGREESLANDAWGRYKARQRVSAEVNQLTDPAARQQVWEQGADFLARCRKRGVPLWFASRNFGVVRAFIDIAVVVLLVLLLWDILGWVLLANPILFLPTHLIAKKKIKDPQFRSSVNWGIRYGFSLVWMLLLFIVGLFVLGPAKAVVLLLLGLFSAHVATKSFVLLRDAYYRFKLAK